MANNCPVLTIATPTRLRLEVSKDGILYHQTFTGTADDTDNFDTETLNEWVQGGTYKVGDWVKIDSLKMRYRCGIDDTTVYPPIGGADWYPLPLQSWSYRDSTPTRQSFKEYDAEDENIVIELGLSMQSNFLFIQNMENINSLKVESIDANGDVIDILDEKDLFQWINFDCCNCCQSTWDLKSNYSLFFNSCNQYPKIRITLYVVEDKIVKVGTCAIGTSFVVGRITKYIAPDIDSTQKLKENEIDQHLDPTAGVSFGKWSVEVDTIDVPNINWINKLLLKNQSQMNYFNFGFPNDDFSIVTGFYNRFKPQIEGIGERPLSMVVNVTFKNKGD